ncbi:hypothetical protein BABINDRAFT_86424 [Babjeviella inositovora NRRL Y-12698]|uniref:Uncharacterized protein n=1 Tax=Babjeviella inositovora NRRL Y-12698 TaxID=984486 RepID=A0A1E3QLK3_9ASCO|nr:uncharacterized protein BABINDRAFT_86424 [Babjeviella inositovora NRRL Y-12698]ODQ78565.1 hypothetical protein BABINDRAFT_86424 [Babjeviella inositovora NRRL Y-12698]
MLRTIFRLGRGLYLIPAHWKHLAPQRGLRTTPLRRPLPAEDYSQPQRQTPQAKYMHHYQQRAVMVWFCQHFLPLTVEELQRYIASLSSVPKELLHQEWLAVLVAVTKARYNDGAELYKRDMWPNFEPRKEKYRHFRRPLATLTATPDQRARALSRLLEAVRDPQIRQFLSQNIQSLSVQATDSFIEQVVRLSPAQLRQLDIFDVFVGFGGDVSKVVDLNNPHRFKPALSLRDFLFFELAKGFFRECAAYRIPQPLLLSIFELIKMEPDRLRNEYMGYLIGYEFLYNAYPGADRKVQLDPYHEMTYVFPGMLRQGLQAKVMELYALHNDNNHLQSWREYGVRLQLRYGVPAAAEALVESIMADFGCVSPSVSAEFVQHYYLVGDGEGCKRWMSRFLEETKRRGVENDVSDYNIGINELLARMESRGATREDFLSVLRAAMFFKQTDMVVAVYEVLKEYGAKSIMEYPIYGINDEYKLELLPKLVGVADEETGLLLKTELARIKEIPDVLLKHLALYESLLHDCFKSQPARFAKYLILQEDVEEFHYYPTQLGIKRTQGTKHTQETKHTQGTEHTQGIKTQRVKNTSLRSFQSNLLPDRSMLTAAIQHYITNDISKANAILSTLEFAALTIRQRAQRFEIPQVLSEDYLPFIAHYSALGQWKDVDAILSRMGKAQVVFDAKVMETVLRAYHTADEPVQGMRFWDTYKFVGIPSPTGMQLLARSHASFSHVWSMSRDLHRLRSKNQLSLVPDLSRKQDILNFLSEQRSPEEIAKEGNRGIHGLSVRDLFAQQTKTLNVNETPSQSLYKKILQACLWSRDYVGTIAIMQFMHHYYGMNPEGGRWFKRIIRETRADAAVSGRRMTIATGFKELKFEALQAREGVNETWNQLAYLLLDELAFEGVPSEEINAELSAVQKWLRLPVRSVEEL